MRARPVAVVMAASLLIAGSPLGDGSAAAAKRPGRVRFAAPADGSLLVHGTYPPVQSFCAETQQPLLHARFRGTVEVGKASDGSLFVIGELPFEDYLKGIAEVPRRWHMEALKAQVVAARSYAMVRLSRPSDEARALRYDLCATTACQVYTGMGVEAGPWGDRWVRAVEGTAGQVLLYQGDPAETLYFSTSNGRTLGNERVFGGSPLPYLRGIRERDDGASPLSRWKVTVPFDDLGRFLDFADLWPGGRIRRVIFDHGDIRVRGGGRRVALDRGDLRDALNFWARCLEPGSYPTSEPDGYQLPQTVPSIWYRPRQRGQTLVLDGRGWGHGVGMVQWGAFGKAERGLTYDEILAAYYGGLRPQWVTVPGRIRVLIADDLRSVTVVPQGDAKVRWRRRVPEEPWEVAGGRRLSLRHGFPPPPQLEAAEFRAARRKARVGGPLKATLTLSRSANVRLEFVRAGEIVGFTPWQPQLTGEVSLTVDVPAIPSGRYAIRVAAGDGVDVVRTAGRPLRVRGGSAPASPSPSPTAGTEAGPAPPAAGERNLRPTLTVLGVSTLLLVALLVLTMRRRKGLHRSRRT
ncbi:MAG TPA: SpoIID/LytB domain-containing protein [Actinomycetota bacterium]|jgi:SpoIID/LytB domain protein|nr:SpoIID/LytB domain-containing protein [Actinomycetota bacterium]